MEISLVTYLQYDQNGKFIGVVSLPEEGVKHIKDSNTSVTLIEYTEKLQKTITSPDNTKYVNGEIVKIAPMSKFEAKQFLSNTDWKIIRHMDEVLQNKPTTLTDKELKLLADKRQEARNILSNN